VSRQYLRPLLLTRAEMAPKLRICQILSIAISDIEGITKNQSYFLSGKENVPRDQSKCFSKELFNLSAQNVVSSFPEVVPIRDV
jgi:hypothetical protein